MENQTQPEIPMRKVPILNIILFIVSILWFPLTYLALVVPVYSRHPFSWNRTFLILLASLVLDIVMFILSVIATINSAKRISRNKGLGFCVTSLSLSYFAGISISVMFILLMLASF